MTLILHSDFAIISVGTICLCKLKFVYHGSLLHIVILKMLAENKGHLIITKNSPATKKRKSQTDNKREGEMFVMAG